MSIVFPSVSRYHSKSLRPPQESGDAEEDERASWDWGEALIDCVAYMIDEGSNHTSAFHPFTTREGSSEEIRVTFCFTPPPHVSYFCVAYTSGEDTRFICEPRVLATAGNLALICVEQGPSFSVRSTYYHFFVYHAPTRVHEFQPRLELLPHPEPDLFPSAYSCYFIHGGVGFLRYRTRSGCSKQQLPFTPPTPTLTLTHALARRHKPPFTPYTNNEEFDAYKIATIHTRFHRSGINYYDLYIYDSSRTDAWTHEPIVFLQQETPQGFCSDRVITIAGRTMVWVDLSQGMILCEDLLQQVPPEDDSPRQLRYIQLPPRPAQSRKLDTSSYSFVRDVAVVDDRIKFVDLEIHDGSPGDLNSWTAVTWSMSVGDLEFHKDGEVKSADIASSDALDLGSFFVAHPTLSSHHGDILYLMAKPRLARHDPEAVVIALDMKNKKMERVAKYTTQRGGSMVHAYMLTSISKYLAPPGDSKGNMKRRGQILLGSSRKRPHVTTFMPGYGGDQVEGAGDHSYDLPSMSDDEDNMDLG